MNWKNFYLYIFINLKVPQIKNKSNENIDKLNYKLNLEKFKLINWIQINRKK